MKMPPLALSILMGLYTLLAAIALYRAISIQAIDLFSLGVLPVLVGFALRAQWAGIIFKIYLAIQTLGLSALAGTAIIAYQISPEDVKVVIDGRDISIPLIAVTGVLLLSFQIYVAFAKSTKLYLQEKESINLS